MDSHGQKSELSHHAMSNDTISQPICLICFETSYTAENKLFKPCLCKGTAQHVHIQCLETCGETLLPTIITSVVHAFITIA